MEAEAAKGELGRFAPGLPKISDGQQLFVLNGLSKLAPGGKMAIIQNGSPLFAGDAEMCIRDRLQAAGYVRPYLQGAWPVGGEKSPAA